MITIYQIRCVVNGRCYIGASCDYKKRWKTHLSMLRHKRHWISALQFDWNKFGADSFKLKMIARCKVENRHRVEQKWILHFRSQLYNLSESVWGTTATKSRQASRILKHLHQTGRLNNNTPKQRRDASERMKRLNADPEFRRRVRDGMAPDHLQKMLKAYLKAVKTRNLWSKERREAQAERMRALATNPEVRKKIVETQHRINELRRITKTRQRNSA